MAADGEDDPGTGHPAGVMARRTGWIWAVAPATPGVVEAGPATPGSQALLDAGWRPGRAVGTVDEPAIRLVGGAEVGALLAGSLTAALPESGLLLAVPAGRGAAAWRAARRLAAAGAQAGAEVAGLAIRNPRAGHRLAAWGHVPDPLARPLVVLGREPWESALDTVQARAASAIGLPLERHRCRLLAGSAVLAEVAGAGSRGAMLRLAAGRTGELLGRAAHLQRVLASAGSEAVARRMVAPLAQGAEGRLRWTLEPRAPGRAPRILKPELLGDCIEFLSELRATPPVTPTGDAADGAGALGAAISKEDREVLARARAELSRRLAGVPRGWTHGDFWPANLLVQRGRLSAVIDWDGARPDGLPLTDLLHLLGYTDRVARRLPLGRRCTDWLWPLARAGGDDRIRAYCERVVLPADGKLLGALAVAYWLERVDRDVGMFPQRTRDRQWMDANVRGPLAHLRDERV
jgi:hypothetical protein